MKRELPPAKKHRKAALKQILVLGFTDFLDESNKMAVAVPYTAAFIAAFIMSYFALRWFMGLMKSGKLTYFTYYCFIVGILLLIFL